MKLRSLIVFVLLLVPHLALAQNTQLTSDQIDDIAKSVVQIVALENGKPFATGSGTIVTPTGLIITNRHVVEDGEDYQILMLDDVNEAPVLAYYASLLAQFDEIDFAVLEIDRDARGRSIDPDTLDLPHIGALAEEVHRGDQIFVFGYPGIGDGYLVFTEGIITTIRNGEINNERVEIWYQTNAEMAPGNSGGLAVNLQGELVGIPTAVRTEDRTGGRLGGILPIFAIQAMLRQLDENPDSTVSSSGTVQLDYRQDPTFGFADLTSGFEPDPYTATVTSGNEVNTTYLGKECAAFTGAAPDFRLQWTGHSRQLRFVFIATDATSDPVIIVNDPDANWYCNDNADSSTLDSMVVLDNPPEGQYDVWIGNFSAAKSAKGTLYITERQVTP